MLWWETISTGSVGRRCVALCRVPDRRPGLAGPVLERLVPGDGEIPIGPMTTAALAAGFAGPFEIEIVGSAIEHEGYEGAVRRSVPASRGHPAGSSASVHGAAH